MKRTNTPTFPRPCASECPGTDLTTRPGPGRLSDSGSGSPAAAFRRFRTSHRRREELCGLPLAAVHALADAREARFAGYLTIRGDLDAPVYLDVPFVRRAWRLLHFLVTGEPEPSRGCAGALTVAEGAPTDPHSAARCVSPQHHIPVSWTMTRHLGMDPETARVNIGVLLTILTAAGFLDPASATGLTPRAATLVRTGTVGEFYKALTLRIFSGVPWVFDDALPQLAAVHRNGLFLTYAVAADVDGVSAWDLAGRLAALSHTLRVRSDRDYWVSDPTTMAAAIHARFLTRVGRMLGLFEEARNSAGIVDPVRTPYRTTVLCRRTFCWQV